MKAIRVHKFGGPEVLQLEEVPDPKPGEGQALVRIHAVGVNPVETYVRSGAYPQLPTLPYIPGADGAGVVKALGPGVTALKVGDRVYLTGTAGERMTGVYAELAVVNVGQAKPLAGAAAHATTS